MGFRLAAVEAGSALGRAPWGAEEAAVGPTVGAVEKACGLSSRIDVCVGGVLGREVSCLGDVGEACESRGGQEGGKG